MDKLTKVLKFRVQQERDSAGLLARSQHATEQAEDQQRQLGELTTEYRRQHRQLLQAGANRFRDFHRFYGQLSAAVTAQREVVEKLVAAEARVNAEFIAHHQNRRALEVLLQQRDVAHKTRHLRAERRAAARPRRNPMV